MPQPPPRRLSPCADASPLAAGRPLPRTNLDAAHAAPPRSLTAASASAAAFAETAMETPVRSSSARSPRTMAEPCRAAQNHDGGHPRLHRRCASASASTAVKPSSSPPPNAAAAAKARGEEERRLRRSPPSSSEAARRERERERRRSREQQPRCGEVAGGTAAECAAVCCCFPCAVVELVVLAAPRVPAALCRRALRARKRRRRARARKKEAEELAASDAAASKARAAAATDCNGDAMDFCYWPPAKDGKRDELAAADEKEEEEIWARFQGAGFWRSPSQREERR
ncbi:unnamed protein product [Urochloa humidicola]